MFTEGKKGIQKNFEVSSGLGFYIVEPQVKWVAKRKTTIFLNDYIFVSFLSFYIVGSRILGWQQLHPIKFICLATVTALCSV